jgi:hypothetical protein
METQGLAAHAYQVNARRHRVQFHAFHARHRAEVSPRAAVTAHAQFD